MESTPNWYDMHCHLDTATNSTELADVLAASCLGAFSTTVEPQDYERALAVLAPNEHIRVGLGLHPWWVADGTCGGDDVCLFEELARTTHFIGEIGLDFAERHQGTQEVQLDAFVRAVRASKGGGRVLSIHAVQAASVVLDVLEREGVMGESACIFHWFSGTSDELTRAMRQGCYVSVNPRMLTYKRGRAYAQAVPATRLLLETDMPNEEGGGYNVALEKTKLQQLLADLAVLRRTDSKELSEQIAQTSRLLLA